jgi:predicted DsbA family dithiol-disulfide isomerase/uncharacterized membrane protein
MGVPISHLGTAFYVACAALAVFALIRLKFSWDQVGEATSPIVVLLGLGSVGYSVYLATLLVRAGDICPLCIALYGVNAIILATGAVWWLRGTRRAALRPMMPGFAVIGLVGTGFVAVSTPTILKMLSVPPVHAEIAVQPDAPLLSPFTIPDRAPSKGGAWATHEILEISDLACPHCAILHRTLGSALEDRGPAGLRVRFMNYPLDSSCNPHIPRPMHPTACQLARGGICAQEQERFWQYIDAAFALRQTGAPTAAIDAARDAGLELAWFEACLDAESTAQTLAEDIALAHGAGVRVTPTVLVNGLALEGAVPLPQIEAILDDPAPRVDVRSGGGCKTEAPVGSTSARE